MSERIRRTRRGRPARRVYFFKQRAAYARLEDGLGDAWTDKRLAEPGTPLPVTFPWRAAAIAAGVLAIEDIDGASIVALTTLGLNSQQATDIFNRIERIRSMPTIYFQSGPQAGQPYDQDEVTLFASAARTTSFTTDAYEVGDRATLRLTQNVTAISGAGALQQVQIETRKDSTDAWRVAAAFPAAVAVGTYRHVFKGLDHYVRAVVTIAGSTPSVTSSLYGAAL